MSSYISYHSHGNKTKGWLACKGATDFWSLSDEFFFSLPLHKLKDEKMTIQLTNERANCKMVLCERWSCSIAQVMYV